ncbi:nucleotide exchange factor GrpE [Microbispora hainanensis]|jgi:molecular chaperone GrpE|uniref:Protein GrpE n=1 Tax=Microbispora hainanensis TaxID=568844 RepID=A0ABZ1ST45_9ACTN|nr:MULTISPECIES: nucleotide exchange factor GrpE [Microbispora]NJP25344.1 nucleotide exchange factor GrpE [Microbispora sp. CL1-1]TQS13787.1 nucleotide exchange factor GrpE [Microbispora sp. SCL1-1]
MTERNEKAPPEPRQAVEEPVEEPIEEPVAEQLAELEDRWLRAVAELDNLRKRVARDMERQRIDERMRVAAEWLPVVDNLELALKHAGADAGAVIEGVRAVRDQAVGVLARLGFPRRDDVGARFDPARHEAVGTVAVPDADPGTVVEVVRPGYGEGELQLRPAAVVVSTKAGE